MRTPEQKAALAAKARNHRALNPEHAKAVARSYRRKNAAKIREWRMAYYARNRDRIAAKGLRWVAANRARANQNQAAWNERKRTEMFAFFGDHCALCGNSERQHLTLDHVYGDGHRHRRMSPGTRYGSIMSGIAKGTDSADRYRILCWNCNCSIGIRGWSPAEALQNLYCRDYIAA